jgi:hypothetical protein
MKSIYSNTQDMLDRLQPLVLPPQAVQWLIDLNQSAQGLDDWYDDDQIPQYEKLKVIHLCLVGLSSNVFFLQHHQRLLPLLNSFVLKWAAANDIEDKKIEEHIPKAYMWRAGFYDIVLEVVSIVHGFDVASNLSSYVLKMYGEPYGEYSKEFLNG